MWWTKSSEKIKKHRLSKIHLDNEIRTELEFLYSQEDFLAAALLNFFIKNNMLHTFSECVSEITLPMMTLS